MHLNMVTPPSLSYTKFKYYKSVLYLSLFFCLIIYDDDHSISVDRDLPAHFYSYIVLHQMNATGLGFFF